MSSNIQKVELSNGLRILCEHVEHVQSVAVGIWCQTGSRMETTSEAGISHLIEHMLFKGTSSRSAEQIAQEIEGRGGHLNAFTDREQTCYYARSLSEDLTNTIDVLSDMMTDSQIDADALELEKGVVQEEIKKYEDSPEEQVHDLHARKRWGDHPLGRPIIGTHDSVGAFDSGALKEYMGKRYVAKKALVAVTGNCTIQQVQEACEKRMGALAGDFALPVEPPPTSAPGDNLIKKDVEQVHFCYGGDSVNIYDERRFAMTLLDSVLGGSMSSRLFQEIREKRGLAYAIGSYSLLYREAGAFTIYGGSSPKTFNEVRELIDKELKKIRDTKVPDEELKRTKKMLTGGMVLGLEGMSSRMHRMARNELLFGMEITIEETMNKVHSVTADQIQALANEFLMPESLTLTAIGDVSKLS